MAFSQVQCLDDSHVNWRSSESKPEFFYSEEQRLALEALVAKGPEAFYEVLKKESIRNFLSELELKKVLETLETYDPGAEYPLKDRNGCVDNGSQTDDQGPGPSLEYWPERSDRSIPQLDLGWPEAIAYRGVTRAAVYMQPPIDYQPHIKEVVRKMIFQAQKVVAVVMDTFTDVDIFKDLLEAGFKRKVAIYIIIDESNLKYFLQMCERAQMHAGHLKNLRIGTIGGTEFFTRSAMKFKGALAQKFMFVDGDKAMCGSYSFTWAAARTDRNVISVLSGQVVEAFDKQFQELYLMSRSISLKSIPLGEEPEPEPVILPSVISLTPASSTAKKLINPKYALVKAKSTEQVGGSGKASSDKVLTEQQTEVQSKLIPENRVSERPSNLMEKVPLIHPGLLNLEKANMFDYLPTWVEPDPEPGSEILGYINIIDPKVKNIQLSQINRIKVCDVSKANAQHRQLLKQQKAQEAKNKAGQEGAKNKPSQTSPPLAESAPLSAQDQEPSSKPLATSLTEKNPGHLVNGETIATLANNRHLKQLLDPQADDQRAAAPVPKPRRVHTKDPISKKTGYAEKKAGTAENPVVHQPGTITTNPSSKEETPQIANTGNHLKVSMETAGTQEGNVLPVNGVQSGEGEAEEEEEEDYVTFSDHGSLSNSSPAHSCNLSNASIHSDKHGGQDHICPLRRTNSDFLLNGEGPSLHHLQRKLSEPYISWGTFVSPLGSPPPRLTPPLEEAAQRRRRRKSDSLEETRCVWERGLPLHALPAGYITCPSDALQGPQLFCYGSRVQVSAERAKSHPQQQKSSKEDKGPQDRTGAKKLAPPSANPLFWQRKNFTSAKNAQPSPVFHRGGTSTPRATGQSLSPLPEGQRSPKEIRTPLGIPLSKLSQSKHLKSKASQWESKRKPAGTSQPKDQ